MATRFYLPAQGAAAASPAFAAGWNDSSQADRLRMATAKQATAMATKTAVGLGVTGDYVCVRQYVSDPLNAQTIAGSVSGQIRCSDAVPLTDTYTLAVTIYVVGSDGATVTGTLLALQHGANAFVGSLTNRFAPASAVLSSVACNQGDRIVIEVGFFDGSAVGSVDLASLSFGDDNATDLPADETTTAANNPWVEFTQNLVFDPALPPGTGAVAVTPENGAVLRTRREMPRRFPLQGFTGDALAIVGAGLTPRAFYLQRLLGPKLHRRILNFPSQQMQTVKVLCVAVGTRRGLDRQRFPPQSMESAVIAETGFSTAAKRGAFERALGPDPPAVILALPPQWLQTVGSYWQRTVLDRRASERRRFPLQGFAGALTRTSALSDGGTPTMPMRRPLLGPRPPQEVTPLPTQRQQTVVVCDQAVLYRRGTEKRRFPPQSIEPATTKTTGAGAQTLGVAERALGPDPPQLILPLPSLVMQTVRVACVAVRTRLEAPRRAPHYQFQPIPFPVGFPVNPPVETTLTVTLQAVARRIAALNKQPHWKLSPPTVLSLPPPPLVRLQAVAGRLGILRRPARHTLGVPTVLQTFPGPQTALVAVRDRFASLARRGPASALAAPLFYPATSEVQVTLAGRTRADAQRRQPRYRLGPPQALQTFAAEAVQDRIGVALAASPRRHDARSTLAPPAVVLVPAVQQQQQTIRTRIVAVATARGSLVQRGPHTRVFPPTVVRVPAVEQQEDTIRVTPAWRTRIEAIRRGPHSLLRKPIVVLPLPTLRAQTVSAVSVAVRTRVEFQRRLGRHLLRPPTVVSAPPTQRQQTVQVTLAGRTRLEAQRRAPHYRIAAPTKVAPLPTQQQQTVTVALTAVAARAGYKRRAPHLRLGGPTVVLPLPGLRAQTILAWLAGRTRLDDLRRGVRSRLGQPGLVSQPAPPAPTGGGVGGSGFPPIRVERLLDQLADHGIDSLTDDEVAILLLLGLI